MPKTTDLSKLYSQQLRPAYKAAVKRIEKATTWGDFMHCLNDLLLTTKYAVWRGSKFDPESGRVLELTLKSELLTVRDWCWHPHVPLPMEFKVPACAEAKLKTIMKDMTKIRNADHVLWYADEFDAANKGPVMLLMDLYNQTTSSNITGFGSSVNVLRFAPILRMESFSSSKV